MKRVTVVRGGPSNEYDVSLRSGAAVLEALTSHGYQTQDVIVTKKGEWLQSGMVRNPEQILDAVDVVFIALHGAYGEDGQIQKILQRKHIPFTGSRSLSSAIAYNKELTKRTLSDHTIKMPKHVVFTRHDLAQLSSKVAQVMAEIGPEVFAKPTTSGSSLGATYLHSASMLEASLSQLLHEYESVLVEEYIRGREATVGVLHDFRGHPLYVLPPVEIVPPGGAPLFSHEDKYSGVTEEICPGRFSYEEKAALSTAAALVHTALGCDHYSRSDFIVRRGEVFFLEINTLPGLTTESLFPKAAAAVGLEFKDLIRHLVETARV